MQLKRDFPLKFFNVALKERFPVDIIKDVIKEGFPIDIIREALNVRIFPWLLHQVSQMQFNRYPVDINSSH